MPLDLKIHHLFSVLVCFLLLGELITRCELSTNAECGYATCPKTKPGMLNVHIVPHTHNDVGWIKTFDEYYYETVQKIISSVVAELLKDPRRRFIYAESAFFFKWWQEQSPQLQQKVKMLVNEGRLEFVGGAWSMSDEATTLYQSIIDEFSWGLRRLNDTFGKCGRPRVGWQIDPFGHSRQIASIFSQMSYDGLFFGRLDYNDKSERLNAKRAEMIWHASPNLGESSNLFTVALFNQYQSPHDLCSDTLCEKKLFEDEDEVKILLGFVKKQRNSYRSNNILITFGGDFHFQNAEAPFVKLDGLIRNANEYQRNGSDLHVFYSTPSCYLKSVHDAGLTWTTKDDDFFPYASSRYVYWTGYYTSRPTLKRFERIGNHFLQVCKQLSALAPQQMPYILTNLNLLREAMGVLQHHDAVTGTAKQYVTNDYARMLEEALRACGTNTRAILNHLAVGQKPMASGNSTHDRINYNFEFQSCRLENISECSVSEQSKRFILTLYNPLSQTINEYVRVPVPGVNYLIRDYKANTVQHQIVPIPEAIGNLTFRNSRATYELIFLANKLPPMRYKSYYIEITNDNNPPPMPEIRNFFGITTIGNEHISLKFNSHNFLSTVTYGDTTRIVTQDFAYYQSKNRNSEKQRPSGAYSFRPSSNCATPFTDHPKVKIYRGNLVEEVHQKFNEWISQVVRVYRNEHFAEFEWMIGPIPVEDNIGKDIITRFNSDISSKGIFFTDSNGREMIKRRRDHRNSWNFTLYGYTPSNYYPVTTRIALENDNARMSILTDRAQGGSSLDDGSLELMVHRRHLRDDGFGVEEALNETAFGKGLITRGKHLLFVGSSQVTKSPTMHAAERLAQLRKLLPPWKFLSDAEDYSYEEWLPSYQNMFSGLTTSLPQNVHILSFEPWHANEILIRFEHLLEKNEDPDLSNVTQFNLRNLLHDFKVVDLQETTLDGNKWLSDSDRLRFLAEEGLRTKEQSHQTRHTKQNNTSSLPRRADNADRFLITLSPMQIRTFLLTLDENGPK